MCYFLKASYVFGTHPAVGCQRLHPKWDSSRNFTIVLLSPSRQRNKQADSGLMSVWSIWFLSYAYTAKFMPKWYWCLYSSLCPQGSCTSHTCLPTCQSQLLLWWGLPLQLCLSFNFFTPFLSHCLVPLAIFWIHSKSES